MSPIIQLILGAVPEIYDLIQKAHADANPGAPPLTADQITAAFEQAYADTIFKDEAIKAANQ